MAQNVIINGITYQNVPKVSIPKSGGSGNAEFVDTSDATLTNGASMLSSVTAYANGSKITGTIASKTAQTYTPTTTDQSIASGQYLAGAQTIKGDTNLQPQYIANGVSIFGVTGTLSSPIISQDTSTKVLSIS